MTEPYIASRAATDYLNTTDRSQDDAPAYAQIAREALAQITAVLPDNVAHYAVEDACHSLLVLARVDTRHPIRTRELSTPHAQTL